MRRKKKNVLVIGDTHAPFTHPLYLPFCKRIQSDLRCEEVVHIGDIVDNHAISYHEHDPNGASPSAEMEHADKQLKEWFKAFPNVKLCIGNHDRMVDRKSRTVGLPERCFKPFRSIWQLPKGWHDDFDHIIDGVKYTHGTGYSGVHAHTQAAYDNRMSTVIGHLHSVAGIEYTANTKDIIFGMSVGCGIDNKAYAFEYGRAFKRKPIISCGVVEYTNHGPNPRLFVMEM